jgi:hypothetical protein
MQKKISVTLAVTFVFSCHVALSQPVPKPPAGGALIQAILPKDAYNDSKLSFLKDNPSYIRATNLVGTSQFEIYLNNFAIIYVSQVCDKGKLSDPFYLHVYPSEIDKGRLPDRRKAAGFENLDFNFKAVGSYYGTACVGVVRLPDWQKVKIQTGQLDAKNGKTVWNLIFDKPLR